MLNNKETIKKVIVLLIFAIAIIIRIIKWPLIMEEINCDEAMTAINAKAISETGCDMYGTMFSCVLRSMACWRTKCIINVSYVYKH